MPNTYRHLRSLRAILGFQEKIVSNRK